MTDVDHRARTGRARMEGERLGTRRTLLAAAFGGAVAAVAGALGRPLTATAANGDRLKIGSTANSATAPTNLNANEAAVYGFGVDYAANGSAIWGNATGSTGVGLRGSASGSNGIGLVAAGKPIGVEAVA